MIVTGRVLWNHEDAHQIIIKYPMRKKIPEDFITKAKKREIKKRPRMQMHGHSLLLPNPHGGKKIVSKK